MRRCPVETCRDSLEFPNQGYRGSDGKLYCWSCSIVH